MNGNISSTPSPLIDGTTSSGSFATGAGHANPRSQFLLATDDGDGDRLLGYARLRFGPPVAAGVAGGAPVELVRLYVEPSLVGEQPSMPGPYDEAARTRPGM